MPQECVGEARLTVGGAFSGIGCFRRAAELAGLAPAWEIEIEPFCRRVLRARWPGVEIHDDITTVEPGRLEPVDVFTFGSPCQDWSVAGKRDGIDGDRSSLFWEAIRVARALRPRWLVFENVPGLLSSWSPTEAPPAEPLRVDGARTECGRAEGDPPHWDVEEESDFAQVLAAFRELGYVGAYHLYDAQWFGVAQRRRRVFAVCCLGEHRLAALLPFLRGGNGRPAPRREAGKGVAPTLESGANRSGGTRPPGSTVDRVESLVVSPSLRAKPNDPHRANMAAYVLADTLSHSLHANGSGWVGDPSCETYVAHTLCGEGFDASEDGTGHGTPIIAFNWQAGGNAGSTLDANGDRTGCLHAGQVPAVAFSVRGQDEGAQAEVNTDGTANALRTPGGGSSHQFVNSGPSVRRLSPTEAERLQGVSWRDPPTGEWTDGHTCLCGKNRGRSVAPLGEAACSCADGPRYRALGNGLAVPVAEWIFRLIQQAEAEAAG